MLVVVQSDDSPELLDALAAKGLRATRIDTAGGFLKSGNVTILVGVEDGQVDEVRAAIQANCRTRVQLVNPLPPALVPDAMFMLEPVEVEVGGATVFVLDVDELVRL
jgi:uncharacterized protein YaaQ